MQCIDVDNFLSRGINWIEPYLFTPFLPLLKKRHNCYNIYNDYKHYSLAMHKFVKLKKIKRKRKHGFFARKAERSGQKVLKRRGEKGRKELTV